MPSLHHLYYAIDWQHPLFLLVSFLLGSCVGSFLNVAIYRLPRQMSVNHPKRSFCPTCKAAIPWYRNLPLLTWLWQRGRCASCGCRIAFRYFAVELLTALLFVLMWQQFGNDPILALFYMGLISLLLVVVFVDAELMVIPLSVTWLGTGLGLLGGLFLGSHLRAEGWLDGMQASLLGFGAGFGALWFTVMLGKLAFGKKNMEFDTSVDWMLKEPEDEGDEFQELCFVIDGEAHGWSDLFYRQSDRLIVSGSDFRVDGKKAKGKELVILGDRIELNGKTAKIEDLKSLSGKARKVTIPREAMGMGDVYLMGMLGACLGWQSVLFTVFVACVFSIVLSLLGRLGFGSRLPFGPSLAFGALCWMFWGWQCWDWYFSLMVVTPG